MRVSINPILGGIKTAYREPPILEQVIQKAVEREMMSERVADVFAPLESVIARLEKDGTVDVQGRHVIFKEPAKGEWYDLPEAMRGLAELHDLASGKHRLPADTSALWKLAAKLDAGSPIFESDIAAVRTSIASCKRQAMQLRLSEAEELVRTAQIGFELDRLKGQAA